MPPSALVDGKSVEASQLTAEEQNALIGRKRTATITMKCSKACPGKLVRTSSHRIAHFAHKVEGECNWQPESPEHELIKRLVVDSAHRQGWASESDAEVTSSRWEGADPESKWRADALLQRDGIGVVVEVQLSSQPASEFERRTQRYLDAGLEVVWLIPGQAQQALFQDSRGEFVLELGVVSLGESRFEVCLPDGELTDANGLVRFLYTRIVQPRVKLNQEIHDAEIVRRTWAAAWEVLAPWNKPDWATWSKANYAIKGRLDLANSNLQALRNRRENLITAP